MRADYNGVSEPRTNLPHHPPGKGATTKGPTPRWRSGPCELWYDRVLFLDRAAEFAQQTADRWPEDDQTRDS